MPGHNEYNDNGYSVANPDGIQRRPFDEGTVRCDDDKKIEYKNDSFSFVRESTTTDNEEWMGERRIRGNIGGEKDPADRGATTTAAKRAKSVLGRDAAVSAATTHATLTVAGVAAVAATTAVVVVAYVATALSLSVSLFCATLHSLTFYLDFDHVESPLVLLLEGDGYRYETDYTGESYVTFEDLQENTQYFFSVVDKASSEVKYRAGFFTSSVQSLDVDFSAELFDDGRLVLYLGVPETDSFYTLTVADVSGENLFVYDGAETKKSFDLNVGDNKTVFVGLKIDNSVVFFRRVGVRTEEPAFDYNNASFLWEDDYSSASAVVPSTDPDGEPMYLAATVTTDSSIEPDCETEGSITYVAKANAPDGTELSDSRTSVLAPLGHDYGEPVFEWTQEEDGDYIAYATFTCSRDQKHVERLLADITTSVIEPPCEGEGSITYTATAAMSGKEYSDATTVNLSATGHKYGTPVFEWTTGATAGYTALATFTCEYDPTHTEVQNAIVTETTTPADCETDGEILYTATVTFEGDTYTDTKTVTIPATGHDYGQPNFAWTEGEAGGFTATATFVCANDQTHTEVLNAIVTETTTPADCETAGEVLYTATVTFEEETYTDTKAITIPATGHDYGQPTFIWTEGETGGYTATATFVCANDQTHTEVQNATVTDETTPADCETDGEILYTATVTFEEDTYTDTKTVTIPATGHTGESAPTAVTITDYTTGEATCSVTYTCESCGEEVTVEHEVKSFTVGENGATYLVDVHGEETEIVAFPEGYHDENFQYSYSVETQTFTVAGTVLQDSQSGDSGIGTSGTELSSVTVPDTFLGKAIATVGSGAFEGAQYASVILGQNVTTLEEGAFNGAADVTSVTINGPVSEIPNSCFSSCMSLSSFTVPSSVTSIGAEAFHGCTSLTTLTIPDTVTEIGMGAFGECSGLTSITLPFVGGSSTATAGSEASAFGYVFSAEEFGDSVAVNSSYGPYYIPGSLEIVTINGGSIYADSFEDVALTSVTIGEGVTTLVPSAFTAPTGGNNVTYVTIAGSSTWIEYDYAEGVVGDPTGNTYSASDFTSPERTASLLSGTYGKIWIKSEE
ncbi:MAG: leucine-rich repeat domain-containing protein [Clostridia bacterium]|nr:leucine-rich repeat domain-containing protein [Clostridia bacterium]